MPVSVPPIEALREFLGATTRHTRRIEIYEQDGNTRWTKDTVTRLKDGSVSVDYDRDERRSLDLTLTNDDGVLINQPGEFWYDKIIKVFRGVQINAPTRLPRVLVISDDTLAEKQQAPSFRAALADIGFGDVQVNTLAANYDVDLAPFDIIVALGDQDKGALLNQAYAAGKTVFTFRKASEFFYNALMGNTTWASASITPSGTRTVASRKINDPRTVGWASFVKTYEAIAYKAPATSITSIFGVAFVPGSTTNYTITSGSNNVGGKFIAAHYPLTPYQHQQDDFKSFLRSSMNWLNPVVPLSHWETQIGEFMIDRISEPHFPYEMKITGRDYTKKCMNSKFSQATQFAAGQSLESLIAAIASNAGIQKRVLPATGVVVGREFFFERGTSRWEAMKEICTAYNYEIFFDATGYLVIRSFRDPTTTTPVLYIQTGKEGQVAQYEKSTSDSRIFNHVLVTGENSDADTVPVWAEAINTNPDSPTSVDEMGDRYWEYSSAFIETEDQALQLAESYLGVHALEEFELSFETLLLPWLEVGDILGWIDPNPDDNDPSTFLLTNMTIPLTLAPMSSSARRVMMINNLFKRIDSGLTWNNIPTDVTWNNLSSTHTWDTV